MAAKTSKKTSKKSVRKLPGFFSFSNRKFVIALVLVIAGLGYGSFQIYKTSAAVSNKTVSQCKGTTLSVGSKGECVKTLQDVLNIITFVLPNTYWNVLNVDGDFGLLTQGRVKAYQRYKNIKADGIVGSQTWNYLQSTCHEVRRVMGTYPKPCKP